MRTGIYINGIEEFDYALKVLGRDGEKMARTALRRASRPMLQEYRRRASAISKTLGDAVGYVRSKNSKGAPLIGIGIQIKKNPEAFFAHFTEYGTSGIKKTKSRGGKKTVQEMNQDFVWVGKLPSGARYRKPQAARPFARPAVDATKNTVKNLLGIEMGKEMKKRVGK